MSMLYATTIIAKIDNLNKLKDTTSEEEKKTLLDEIEKLRLSINNVVVGRNYDGKIMMERWLVDGILHRDDGPAVVSYYDDGSVRTEWWFKHGKIHRIGDHITNTPAVTKYDKGGNVEERTWYREGKKYRDDGPTCIKYHKNGNMSEQQWSENDIISNIVKYHENGNFYKKMYYEDGKRHRSDGPAEIIYYEDGTVAKEMWYIYETFISSNCLITSLCVSK